MALVLICGIPAAGKSRRAHEIADFFQSKLDQCRMDEVHIVDDDGLGIPKSDYYDRETEKKARGKQMSAVKRLLGPNKLVILDNMSYIKGFRYQLYCEAKAARVISCVVYVGTSPDQAAQFNRSTDSERTPWPQDLFDALVFRFEEPNGMTRWDSPLFLVTTEDQLPFDNMWDALINQQPPKPNLATFKQSVVGSDYLSSLNETTSQIIREALDLHGRMPGAQVSLRNRKVQLPYNLTMAQLSRIRRNFVSLNKQTAMPIENIESYFIEFLDKNWNITS